MKILDFLHDNKAAVMAFALSAFSGWQLWGLIGLVIMTGSFLAAIAVAFTLGFIRAQRMSDEEIREWARKQAQK